MMKKDKHRFILKSITLDSLPKQGPLVRIEVVEVFLLKVGRGEI